MRKLKPLKAWHILPPDMKLRFRDDRTVKIGKPISVKGNIKPCSNGLHGSVRLCRAFSSANIMHQPTRDWWICRVELSGHRVLSKNKHAARTRKILWAIRIKDIVPQVRGKHGQPTDLATTYWLDLTSSSRNRSITNIVTAEARKQGLIGRKAKAPSKKPPK